MKADDVKRGTILGRILAFVAVVAMAIPTHATPNANAVAKGYPVTLQHASCGQCDGSADIDVQSPALDVQWSDGYVGTTRSNLCPGTYNVTVTKNSVPLSTQSFTIIDNGCNLVLPGDVDGNGQATKTDIFGLGYHYGDQGPVRPNASWQFVPQIAPNWSRSFAGSNRNIKHADCNGDGTIDEADKDVIRNNLSYPPSSGNLLDNYGLSKYFTITPTITVNPHGSRYMVLADVAVAGPAAQNGGLYQLAFSVDFGVALDTLDLDPDSLMYTMANSWVGTPNVDLIYLAAYSEMLKRYDVGMTRIDKINATGTGTVAVLGGVTSDILAAKDMDELLEEINVRITDAVAYDADGNQIPVIIDKNVAEAVANTSALDVSVFPNPSNGIMNLAIAGTDENVTVRVLTTTGQNVRTISLQPGVQQLDLSDLPNGLYLLELRTDSGLIVKRISTNPN